jgi:hypothetical protein
MRPSKNKLLLNAAATQIKRFRRELGFFCVNQLIQKFMD